MRDDIDVAKMRDDQEEFASSEIIDDGYDEVYTKQSMATVQDNSGLDTEREYMKRRREINRKSARKQRQKQQQIGNDIRQAYYSAKSTNTQLVYTVQRLQRRRDSLKTMLDAHNRQCTRIVSHVDEPVTVDDVITSPPSIDVDRGDDAIRRSRFDVIVHNSLLSAPVLRHDAKMTDNENVGCPSLHSEASATRDIAAWAVNRKLTQILESASSVGKCWTIPLSASYRHADKLESTAPEIRQRVSNTTVKDIYAPMNARFSVRRSVSLDAVATATTPMLKRRLPAAVGAPTENASRAMTLSSLMTEDDDCSRISVFDTAARSSLKSKNVVSPSSIEEESSTAPSTTQINGRLQWSLLPTSVLDAMKAADSEESAADDMTPKASTLAMKGSIRSGGGGGGGKPMSDRARRGDTSGSGESALEVVAPCGRVALNQLDSEGTGEDDYQRCVVNDDLRSLIGSKLSFHSFDNDNVVRLDHGLSESLDDEFMRDLLQSGIAIDTIEDYSMMSDAGDGGGGGDGDAGDAGDGGDGDGGNGDGDSSGGGDMYFDVDSLSEFF